MTTAQELEDLLYVERLHTEHFEAWARKAVDPLAKVAFRMAVDKEANHVRWVETLLEAARQGRTDGDVGVSGSELRTWIEDEDGEGASYQRMAARAGEPWVQAVLRQLAEDEKTNARLLEAVLRRAEAGEG